MRKTEVWLVVCLPPLICAAVAVASGLDANWDLRNYHYYNAYAFLTGRMALDVAPGQLQTFLNPLLDLPFYWLAQAWPPVWVEAALAAVHGLNLTLLALIFDQATQWPDARSRWGAGLLLLWLGLRAPGFLSELGGTMNDDLISLFVLLPLWLLLRAPVGSGQPGTWWQVALAGCVMGAGVGLKPTVAPYALASGVALLWLWPAGRSRWIGSVIYGMAGILGAMTSAGFWWWDMWVIYGNPFFPYMNHLFRSPYIQALPFADTRFLPRVWWEYLVWPLVFSADGLRVGEQPFRDVRFGLLYGVLWLSLAAWIVRWLRRAAPPTGAARVLRPAPARFLAIFAGLSFLLWMGLFSIYRYLIPLELLVPLLALAALEATLSSVRARLEAGAVLALAVVAASQPLSWGRATWPGRYVEVRNLPDLGLTKRSVVMLVGTAPLSYIIPEFPPHVRFVRPEGNLYLRPENRFHQQIAATLADADKVFVVYLDGDGGVSLPSTLSQWGIPWPKPDCFRLDTNVPDNLVVCRAPEG